MNCYLFIRNNRVANIFLSKFSGFSIYHDGKEYRKYSGWFFSVCNLIFLLSAYTILLLLVTIIFSLRIFKQNIVCIEEQIDFGEGKGRE